MKTKTLYFFVLLALLIMVQVSAILLRDVFPTFVSVLIAAAGTTLTLYLGLKVERKRIEREEANDNKSLVTNINEYRERLGLEPFQIHDVTKTVVLPPKTPSAHFLVEGDSIRPLTDPPRLSVFDHGFSEPDEMYLVAPIPEPRMTETAFISKDTHDMLDRNHAALRVEEQELKSDQDICKHCYRQIRGVIHTEGMGRGKMRCDPEDTQAPYGYNAEPTGSDCGVTCLGHP